MNRHVPVHSDYFIDEIGMYRLRSGSYPDYVCKDYRYKFENGTPEQFEVFVQEIFEEGKRKKISELKGVLDIRS